MLQNRPRRDDFIASWRGGSDSRLDCGVLAVDAEDDLYGGGSSSQLLTDLEETCETSAGFGQASSF
jgi:hypothetical protein